MSSRHDDERLADIIDAITAIRSHLTRGDLSDGLIFDAVRVRLIEIGEAVGLALRKAQAPIRCAVTGTLVGPPLFESLELLGRERTLVRLRDALARCSP